mmetsp:Transcript_63859/g.128345  ORF Transcript_63859/g.128345 Transcript_63859/m.128345 type:complete len:210 (-) Transcript_63859:854-1483(-)
MRRLWLCFSLSLSASDCPPHSAIFRSIFTTSIDTCRITTDTVLPSNSTPSMPPLRVWNFRPKMRLQATKKCLAWSNAWNPTTSLKSMPRSNSLPCCRERKIWDVEKGMCRKKATFVGMAFFGGATTGGAPTPTPTPTPPPVQTPKGGAAAAEGACWLLAAAAAAAAAVAAAKLPLCLQGPVCSRQQQLVLQEQLSSREPRYGECAGVPA